MKKSDIILAIALIILSVIVAAAARYRNNDTHAKYIRIETEEGLYGTYPLSEDMQISVMAGEGYNIIEISGGRVRMAQADCSDHYCERMGWISDNGQTIICLPHRLIISIYGGEDGIDAYTE